MNPKLPDGLTEIPIEESLQVLCTAVDAAFNSVVITDWEANILYANPAFCNMTGYKLTELIGQNPKMLQGPLTDMSVIEKLRTDLEKKGSFFGSTINYRKSGQPYLVEWTITPVSNDSGEVRHFISIQKDITQLHAAQSTSNLFAKAIDAAYDGIFITNADGVIEFANQGFEIITGYSPSEVVGFSPSILKSGKHDNEFYRNLWHHLGKGLPFRAMVVDRHKNGHEIHCQQTITPIKNETGDITHFVSIIKDLTDRVFEELKLKEQASHDALTGLLNRREGEIELDLLQIQATEKLSPFCLIMADIDDFKAVNDTYGHGKGDEIIKAVAQILQEETRKTDKCIRWGGEEFIVLLPFCNLDKAFQIAENIRSSMEAQRFGKIGSTTLSLGVIESSIEERPTALLQRVDDQLYAAKRNGKNQVAS
ncbi:MAG: sensor domain-containing diguanylate cyclase [Pseudomonadota bacterium]